MGRKLSRAVGSLVKGLRDEDFGVLASATVAAPFSMLVVELAVFAFVVAQTTDPKS